MIGVTADMIREIENLFVVSLIKGDKKRAMKIGCRRKKC